MKKIFIILLVCFTTIILNASQNILTETQGESYCLSTRNALKGGIEVSMDILKKYNYLTDYDEQCSGTVTLKINNANPEADGSNIECR